MNRHKTILSTRPSRAARALRKRCVQLGLGIILSLVLASCASTRGPSASAPISPLSAQRVNPELQRPVPPAGPNLAQQLPTGSLVTAANVNGSLFQDIKAFKVGDILTITVSETATGSSQANTQTNRTKNFQGSFSFAGAGLGSSNGPGSVSNPAGPASFGPYQGSFTNGFNGTGTTTRADSMSAYMTATVIDVLSNGNLVIRGSRWTKVNDEMQQIVLEGVVRPMDITRNNTILSQNIAEAKIFLIGKGPVSQHQKPGWLGQLMDLVSPF